jgi:hypothetical protein
MAQSPPMPRAPMAPLQPMTPLRPMVPLRPLTPLAPGTRRVSQSPPTEPLEELDVVAFPETLPPPPPVAQQRISRQPAPARPLQGGWSTATTASPAARVRRPSGGGKAFGALGVAIALLVVLAAVGALAPTHRDHVVVSIPSTSVSFPPISKGSGPHPAPTTARSNPRIGQALDLNGNVDGESVRVTLTRWVNNAKPKNTFMDSPTPGKRLVAAQFRIVDTGSSLYIDSPSNGASVVDRSGRKYRSKFMFGGIRQGGVIGAAVTIQTGKSAGGYLVFEVPKHAQIRKVQFSENSGFGQTGVWSI